MRLIFPIVEDSPVAVTGCVQHAATVRLRLRFGDAVLQNMLPDALLRCFRQMMFQNRVHDLFVGELRLAGATVVKKGHPYPHCVRGAKVKAILLISLSVFCGLGRVEFRLHRFYPHE
jgi:hypothetical protein